LQFRAKRQTVNYKMFFGIFYKNPRTRQESVNIVNIEHERKKNKMRKELKEVRLGDFKKVATLGMGGFARVDLVTLKKEAKQSFALKKIKKRYTKEPMIKRHVVSELEVMDQVKSPFLVSLYATFQDSVYFYIVMEVCLGGELWTLLRDWDYFDDNRARFYGACVVEALDYLHANNIVYRDIKPENLLVSTNGYLKLVDFGLAKQFKGKHETYSFCGTADYMSPEVILEEGHSLSTDYWSLGVLIGEMVIGTPPFTKETKKQTYESILDGIAFVTFPRYVSTRARNLVTKLCRRRPIDRLGGNGRGVRQIRNDPWFTGFDWEGLKTQTLQPPFIPKIDSHLDTSNFDQYPADCESTECHDDIWLDFAVSIPEETVYQRDCLHPKDALHKRDLFQSEKAPFLQKVSVDSRRVAQEPIEIFEEAKGDMEKVDVAVDAVFMMDNLVSCDDWEKDFFEAVQVLLDSSQLEENKSLVLNETCICYVQNCKIFMFCSICDKKAMLKGV